MNAEQRLKIILQQYKAGIRRVKDSMEHIKKLNNEYLIEDGGEVLVVLEQYRRELEDELFRVRSEK